MHSRIRVQGQLDPSWQHRFEGLRIEPQEAGTTQLSGSLPDQAALYGVLLQLIRLGLTLLSLEVSEAPGDGAAGERPSAQRGPVVDAVSSGRTIVVLTTDKGEVVMLQLLLASGTIVLLIALVVYQAHKIRWLRDHGRRIIALVTSIRHETGKTKWGFPRDNYYVTATWTDPRTGRTYTFWTWVMNSCPAYKKGSLVPVLIDPKHPGRYVFDL